MVADAAFPNKPFADGLRKIGFHLVSGKSREARLEKHRAHFAIIKGERFSITDFARNPNTIMD